MTGIVLVQTTLELQLERRGRRIYICVFVGVASVRSIHVSSPPTLIHSLPLFMSTSCRSLHSSCLSFYDLSMTLILPVCPLLFFPLLFVTLSFLPPLLSHFHPLLLFPCLISRWINLEAGYQGLSLMGHRDLITTCHHYQLSCLASSSVCISEDSSSALGCNV